MKKKTNKERTTQIQITGRRPRTVGGKGKNQGIATDPREKEMNSFLYSPRMCPYRLVLLFVPELNTGRRYQNTFLTVLWILEITSYFNSSFNIFVYYSMGPRYRETVKALFCRGRVVAKSKTMDREQITTVSVAASTVR